MYLISLLTLRPDFPLKLAIKSRFTFTQILAPKDRQHTARWTLGKEMEDRQPVTGRL